jgi:uncharacterized protein (TIGR02145 family)
MKTKNRFWIMSIILGISTLFLVTNCTKDDDVTQDVTIPVLTTNEVSAITQTTATSGGTITSDDGATVTERGVCWSTSQNPTITDNKTTDGTGAGSFTSNITNLTANTTYYIRAYATNSVGTGYGSAMLFTTLEANTVTDLDGNSYKTVTIGTQTWMAENLNVGSRINSSNGGQVQTDNGIIEKFCYDDDETNCENSGGLYEWDEMMQYNASDNGSVGTIQGICPQGWHLPTDTEWKSLEMYLGMSSSDADASDSYRGTNEGSKLAGDSISWPSGVLNADNEFDISGFTAISSGWREMSDGSYIAQTGAYFWTATEGSSIGVDVLILLIPVWGDSVMANRTA